ncbi:MAG: SLC13 family permease [Chlamydiota bacterium]
MALRTKYIRLFYLSVLAVLFLNWQPISSNEEGAQPRSEEVNVLEDAKGRELSRAGDIVISDIKLLETLNWKGWFTLALLAATILALILEIRPPDITMLISSGILVIVGILPPAKFLDGFSHDIIMTIAMLCIVVRTIEIHGLLDVLAKNVLSTSKNIYRQLVSLMVPVAAASAFLNNTPIVLLMTPMIRRWALRNETYPSKFLIPLSYAAILGGMCTIIGTSTNLVIEGLLRQEAPNASLGFFELSYIGIPCGIAGLVYILLIGRHLTPERKDPLSAAEEDARKFTVEFFVNHDCPLAHTPIVEVAGKYFRNELLVQIERGEVVIDAPSQEEKILPQDRLVFAGDINHIAELHAIEGLQSLADPHFKLDASSSHFSEIVISSTSLMIGKTLRSLDFRAHYGASVLAVYREGDRVEGHVADVELQAGDTLILISSEEWHGGDYYTKDYYCIRNNQKLQVFHPWRVGFIVAVLIAMVTAATMGVSIMISSMAAVATFVFTRMITIREAQNSIVWNVLLLIGCSFAFAKTMVITGVASTFAHIILSVIGNEPVHLVGGILLVAIISTELLSNNAAALILFPIAAQVAKLAGFDTPTALKTVGITIAVGCSCGFAMPTGYQTHMIVFGEGGYKFTDFFKVGIPMDVVVWAVGTLLIPLLWPL